MVMRIGGLASGMDIDELVKKLMQAERAPLDKLFQKKTTYEWQRDAYRGVNTKLKAFDTYVSNNLSLKSINSKTASSSNSDLVSAVATGKASGSLSIEGVSQLAKAARSVGDQINYTGSSKMKDIASGPIEFTAINKSGEMPTESTKIVITEDMTVNDFVKKVNESDAGVSAVFENGRFSFTAKNTGKGEIDIKGTGVENMGLKSESGQNAIFQVNGIATERASNTFSMNGYNVTLKSTFNEGTAQGGFISAAKENLKNAKENLEALYSDLASIYGVTLNNADSYDKQRNELLNEIENKITEYQSTVNNAKSALDNSKNIKSAAFNSLSEDTKNFLNTLNANQLSKLADKDLTTDNLDDLELTEEQKDAFAAIQSDEKDALNALTKEDLTATAGSMYGKLSNETKNLLAGKTLDELKGLIASNDKISSEEKEFINKLSEEDYASIQDVQAKTKSLATANDKLTKAQNNERSVNKSYDTFDAAEKTLADAENNVPPTTQTTPPVTLTSTTNVDDMMKTITDFVDMYNGLIKDLTNQTKESKYRDYKPLSDEQKKDMSENEIKLWEEKAKSGLLRNDSLIQKGLSEMRSLVYQTNPGLSDSKFNSLFSIGITTSANYNEGGTLEIDTEKLRKAIEEDPDAVERLFKNSDGKKDGSVQAKDKDGNLVFEDGKPKMIPADTRGYVEKLRFDALKSFEISIEKKAGRSTMTDAEYSIGKGLIDTDKRIKTWEGKLKMIEARYWKQFGAMESAINKANSQASMFMQGQ